MRLEIFDVEHGQCALLTGDNGETMLIDAGHNSNTGWRPSNHLLNLGINQIDWFVVTNYDEDHVSDLPNLVKNFRIRLLTRNRSVSSADLYKLKSVHGCGNGIDALAKMIGDFTGKVNDLPDFGGMKLTAFCNAYPTDFEDENNLSVATILSWPNFKICFPGDMEKAGWRKLLQNEKFRAEMSNLNVLVASHHGRESGRCDELFSETGLRPNLIVVSDGEIQFKSQETINWYGTKAIGCEYKGRMRSVLSTRNDGTIGFNISQSGVTFYTV